MAGPVLSCFDRGSRLIVLPLKPTSPDGSRLVVETPVGTLGRQAGWNKLHSGEQHHQEGRSRPSLAASDAAFAGSQKQERNEQHVDGRLGVASQYHHGQSDTSYCEPPTRTSLEIIFECEPGPRQPGARDEVDRIMKLRKERSTEGITGGGQSSRGGAIAPTPEPEVDSGVGERPVSDEEEVIGNGPPCRYQQEELERVEQSVGRIGRHVDPTVFPRVPQGKGTLLPDLAKEVELRIVIGGAVAEDEPSATRKKRSAPQQTDCE